MLIPNKDKLTFVKSMHTIICSMNNENAYMSWINEMPDEPSEEDFEYFALDENQDSYVDLVNLFIRIMKSYLPDGLYFGKNIPLCRG